MTVGSDPVIKQPGVLSITSAKVHESLDELALRLEIFIFGNLLVVPDAPDIHRMHHLQLPTS